MVKNGNPDPIYGKKRQRGNCLTPISGHGAIRYQTRLPILKQPVLIYPLRPFLQPDLSEISHISPKPGEKQHF